MSVSDADWAPTRDESLFSRRAAIAILPAHHRQSLSALFDAISSFTLFRRGLVMVKQRLICHILSWLAACGMCLPPSFAFAADGAARGSAAATDRAPATIMRDVALAPGGLLVGQVLDESMKPIRGMQIAIQANGTTTATTETDADGVFAVAGLRGGVHQVVTAQSIENCRLWAAGTAPPRADANLRFVPGQSTVVRGQWGPPQNPWKNLATNPWVIGGVVATAIAVPVVLNNIDDDDEGS
jgi:hypothetical protein